MDWLRRLFQRPQQNNRAQDIINRSRNWGSAAQDLRNAGFNPTQFDAQLKNKFQPRPQPQQQPQQQPQGPHLNIQAFAKGLQDFIQHDVKPIEQKVAPIAKFVVPGAALGQKLSEGAKPTNQPIQKAIVPALGNALMGASLPGVNLVKTPQARQDTVKSVTSVGKAADSFLGSPSQIAHQANYAITEAQARDLLNKRQINYDTYKRVTDEALGKTTINPSDTGGTLFRKVAGPVASTAFSLISAGELPGAVKAAAPLTLGQKVIKGAKAGAGLGATYGALGTLGQKEAITPTNAAQNVASGAAFGGVLGAATPLAAAGASKLLNHELTPKSPLVMTPQKSKTVAYDLNPVRDNVGKYSKKPNTIPLQLDNMKAYQQDMLNTMTRPGISATEKAGAMKNYNATQKVIDQLESGQPLKLKGRPINDNFNGNLNPIKSSLDVVKYPNAEAFAKAHPEVTAGLSKAQINELYQTAQKAPASVVAGLDSRPAHQVAIENALNKGDIKTAKQLVAKIPKNDPYRASMESFVNDAGVQTAKYSQKTNPLEALKAEAKKYKSAEEFVKAKTNQYHGTLDKEFKLDPNSRLFLTGDTDSASTYAGRRYNQEPEGKVVGYHAKDGKTLDLNDNATREEYVRDVLGQNKQLKKYYDQIPESARNDYFDTLGWVMEEHKAGRIPKADLDKYTEAQKNYKGISSKDVYANWDKIIARAKKDGYDYIKHTTEDPSAEITFPETVALNPSKTILDKQQLTDLYNQATKGKTIYDNYTGPLKPEKGKKVDKIAEGLGMTEQQVNEAAGKSAPGLSIKDTNTLKKLGYTVDDFANLKPGELKLALQKGLPRDQVYKGLSAVPDLTTPKGPGEKPRGFVSSLNKDILFPSEVSGALPQGYKPITNKQTVEQARRLVDADPSASLSRFLTKPKNEVTAVDQAVGQIHLRRAIDTENTALATRLIGKIDPNAREAGRTVQILAAWKKTTPEGALSEAHKIVDEANTKLGKNKQLTLSADAQKRIVEIAKNIQKFEVGTRDRQVQEALLQKELAGIVPAGKLRKISTLQTLGQLLNPKTAIRNIGGNSFLAGTENVSQSIATPLDAILGKFTKQRSVVLPKLGQELKGAKIGAQYGAEDVKLGIKSQGSEGQYSLHPDIFKKGGLLNKAEKLMGYELSVPDKAFYTAAYNESLANQVAAANKSGANLVKPTAQMKLQAESEGLYRTFQNDSKLAGWLSSAKRGLNANKDFGLGDLILKYPRTPGNIVSVGIDYAGGGAVKGVNKLVHNWGNLSPETQRQAVMDISRSITGLGMAGGAYALAKEGIIKGKQNKDKDIASAEKGMGQGPYTINLSALMRKLQGKSTEARPGDLTTNYDWIQPNAINAAIGANMASKTGAKQGIANIAESLNQGVSTVVDQPVMQGLSRLASKMAGQQGADPVGAIADAVKGAPASFVPSLLNQIGQLTDKPSRNTYSPNPIQEAGNMVKAKIPGLRTTLNPRYDTLGQAQQLYESNNPFNVFLNPAFVNHYKNNPVIDEVRRLEQTTSETSQYPRLVNTSQTINGQNRKLTSDELAKWQKGLGELTNNQLSTLIQTPAYQKLSDPDKVKAIQNALTSFNQITKNTIFGGEKLSKAEQAVAGGGNYAIKEKQPPKAKKAKKLKAPKKSTRGKRATGRKSSGRVAITKPPALHLSKLSIGRSPSIKSVKLKSTAKLVSPKTSSKKITIKA